MLPLLLLSNINSIIKPRTPLSVVGVSGSSRNRLRQSLGSTSTGSANDHGKLLAQLCAYVEDEDTELHFGKNLVSYPITAFDRSNLPVIKVDDLVELANVQAISDKAFRKAMKSMPAHAVAGLVGKDETELQESLKKSLICAVDTHTSIGTAVEFMPPRKFAHHVVAFSNTGKADYTSSVRRMVFEVKSSNCEYALLLQMLDRLAATMDTSHLLKNVLVFGATPSEAFVFVGRRKIPASRQAFNVKSLHIFRTTHDKVMELWWRASYQCTPASFLTEDAPYVLHALQRMHLDPWLCRVHLCGWSQSRVYDITLPSKLKWPKGQNFSAHKHCVGVVANAVTFALKVVGSDESFEKEAKALNAIKPSFLLGHISFCDSSVPDVLDPDVCTKAMRAIQTERSELLGKDDSAGWWRQLPKVPSSGGVVIMKFGTLVVAPDTSSHETRCQMFDNCLESLKEMHGHKYCHTDVRLANILRFDNKYALVDFGEAVRRGSYVRVSDFSEGRRKLLAAGCSSGVAVLKWGYVHDVEMLTRTCFGAPTTTNTSSIRSLLPGKRHRGEDAEDEQEGRCRLRIL